MIPANDFKRQWEDVRADVQDAVERVGASGWYVLGEEVRSFESSLAARWGLGDAVGVASGLDAIEISLRVLGCRTGDRVLTTPLSAFATTLAILKIGAVPVFVDTDRNGLIRLDRCRKYLERNRDVRFFVPVHLYGMPLDTELLTSLRDDFDLKIVEDCAQSIGARFRGQNTGSVGQMAATSFYPTKNLGAMGDGGAILTSNPAHAEMARSLRDYGQTAKYRHAHLGYNSRLDELQAAILRQAFLPRLDRWTQRRREIAGAYQGRIRNPAIRTLDVSPDAEPGWHLFPVFTAAQNRDALMAKLKAAGIGAAIHYPAAIVDQPALRNAGYKLAEVCQTASELSATEISLPIHPYMTDGEVEHVIATLNRA